MSKKRGACARFMAHLPLYWCLTQSLSQPEYPEHWRIVSHLVKCFDIKITPYHYSPVHKFHLNLLNVVLVQVHANHILHVSSSAGLNFSRVSLHHPPTTSPGLHSPLSALLIVQGSSSQPPLQTAELSHQRSLTRAIGLKPV